MLKAGVLFDLVVLVLLCAMVIYYLWLVSKGRPIPRIRRIPAVDAIEEGVGRCAEMGRPIHYSVGDFGQISGEWGPAVISALSVYKHTLKLAAKQEVPVYTSLPGVAEIIPVVQGIAREAYRAEGKPELYKEEDILYYGPSAYKIARCGTVLRNNVALNVQVGVFYTEIQSHAVAAQIGAINIGGTTRWTAMYGQAITCDYVLICEEVLAAGTLVSGDPSMTASLAGEDIVKMFLIGIGALCIITGLMHIDALTKVLKM
mgnify:CR=1 FL=1